MNFSARQPEACLLRPNNSVCYMYEQYAWIVLNCVIPCVLATGVWISRVSVSFQLLHGRTSSAMPLRSPSAGMLASMTHPLIFENDTTWRFWKGNWILRVHMFLLSWLKTNFLCITSILSPKSMSKLINVNCLHLLVAKITQTSL